LIIIVYGKNGLIQKIKFTEISYLHSIMQPSSSKSDIFAPEPLVLASWWQNATFITGGIPPAFFDFGKTV
jgi:hypothetical protein